MNYYLGTVNDTQQVGRFYFHSCKVKDILDMLVGILAQEQTFDCLDDIRVMSVDWGKNHNYQEL